MRPQLLQLSSRPFRRRSIIASDNYYLLRRGVTRIAARIPKSGPRDPDLWEKARAQPILEVARLLGLELKNNKMLCIAGHDKNPSLSFEPKGNYFLCFGCGITGSPIDLVQRVLGGSAYEAAKWLTHTSTSSPRVSSKTFPANASQTPQRQTDCTNPITPMPDAEVYEDLIDRCLPIDEATTSYLTKQRGFTVEIIRRFQIAQLKSPALIKEALLTRWGRERLRNCGVITSRSRNGRNADALVWWDGGVLFPAKELGSISYLQLRRVTANTPKYVGLIGVKKPLFNTDILDSLAQGSRVCICEGIPDTIAATQLGWHAVGVLGAASFRVEWVDRLLRFTVVVASDGDFAGDSLYRTISAAFRLQGRSVERLRFSRDQDFNSILVDKQGRTTS